MKQNKFINEALQAIESEDQIAIDLADEHCQIFDNVKHMKWFIKELADRIKASRNNILF